MAEFYAGKWNGHQIIVQNSDAEKLMIDGNVAAENKKGIHLGAVLTAPLPDTDGLYVYVMLFASLGTQCCCIVGKPLETEYDKKTKAHTAEYNGHLIEARNKLRAVMFVDGEEVDKQESIMESVCILGTKAPDSDKRFMAVFDGVSGGLKAKVQIYAEAENVSMAPCREDAGQLIPLTMEEIEEEIAEAEAVAAGAAAAATAACILS